MPSNPERSLWHQSGVNSKGKPFVQLVLRGRPIAQMSPKEARDHGAAIIETAEAAEQDAFMVDFAKTQLGLPQEAAIAMLMEFRKFRESKGRKGPPTDKAEWAMPQNDPS